MEKLIKSALGQWDIVSESLRKSPEDMPAPSNINTPKVNVDPARNEKLTELFKTAQDKYLRSRSSPTGPEAPEGAVQEFKGNIKDYILGAPKGSIDMGHLRTLRKQNNDVMRSQGEHRFYGSLFSKIDEIEAFNHHEGDVGSLKELHDRQGDKGMHALMHMMGGNGDPLEYSDLNLKPKVHADLLTLLNPGKAKTNRNETRHLGVLPHSQYDKTQANAGLHSNVHHTYMNMDQSWGETDESQRLMTAHGDAVMARAMERFKRHHGIKDEE